MSKLTKEQREQLAEELLTEPKTADSGFITCMNPENMHDRTTDDLISRQAAIEALKRDEVYDEDIPNRADGVRDAIITISNLPSAEPEPLTDKEQRIFLAAMSREMKVCEEVDRNYTREPYEDSLVRVCREIERKVKSALWT